MQEAAIAALIFACLVAASLASQSLYRKIPERHRQDDTHQVVTSLAGIFVVMTSLVLGLLLNSAKNTFEQVDHNMHTYATDLILLDRTLVQYGPEAADTRQHLLAYVTRAANSTRHDDPLIADRTSEALLDDVGKSLRTIAPDNSERIARWKDAEQQFRKIVELRWTIVEQSEGTIPMALIAMIAAQLMLIFLSFGYRAPRNAMVVTSFVVSAGLIAGTIYLALDMHIPIPGSDPGFHRTAAAGDRGNAAMISRSVRPPPAA
jgi:hypothetical protein